MGEIGDLQVDSCLIFAATSFWLTPASYLAILKVVLGLGFVIFVHELGHFLVAKMCGVKCEKFYVGFDVPIQLFGRTIIPGKLFSFTWGETEYGIGSIPLGGYVKMLGQDDNPGNVEEQLAGSLAEGESADSAILESGLVDQSKLDPRSFLAKSVLQRMMIISAGVVFNLIFAILFAALAFKSGVDYEPPVLGNAIGSGPAWKYDLTGADVLAIGDKKVEGYFPFMNFVEAVIFNGSEKPIPLTYLPHGETEPKTIEMFAEKGFNREHPDLAMVGIQSGQIPKIGDEVTIKGLPASRAMPPLMKDDVVVEVNGTPIKNDIDLRQVLARDAAKVANFVLERTTGENESSKTEKITTSIEPTPFRDFGFTLKWGKVGALKLDSPAAQADLRVGDEIVSINDQPRGDLMTLDMRMIAKVESGSPVALQVKRGDDVLDVSITPVVPKLFANVGPGTAIAIDSLGVAIKPTLIVETVVPSSPADKAGLKTNDSFVFLDYLLSEIQLEDDRYTGIKKTEGAPKVKFNEGVLKTTWGEVYANILQTMEIGTEIEVTVKRGEQEKVVKMASVVSEEFFQPTRGFYLQTLQKNYKSDTWSDAFTNGTYQVGKDIKRVGTTLRKLIGGEISPTKLGGPGTIALVATSEASQSTSRLLLFLTFLSANLAIVNFLPIPMLDGGHMMFLIYEGLFRRPVNEKVQMILTYGGLLFILGLMLFVITLDIGRFGAW